MAKYAKPAGTTQKSSANPLEQEDAFVARTLEVSNWAQRNRPLVTGGLVLLVVGVLAFLYYGNYKGTLNQQAATQLEQIQQRLEAGDQEGSKADLELFLQRFGNTASAGEARLVLGQVTADLGDPNGAVDILEPTARDVRSPLGAQAAALLAAIYEDSGNLQAAEGLYIRLADQAELGFQVRDALADAARLRKERGDVAGAISLYDRLLDEMDETDPTRGLVEMRRAELEAEG